MVRGFNLNRMMRGGGGGGKTAGIPNKLLLIGGGLLGAAGLYYILAGKQTGFPAADYPLGVIGDITGLEGRGPSLAPSIFGSPVVPAGAVPPATPVKPLGLAQDFSGGYMGESYATYPEAGWGVSQAYLADAASGYEDWYSNTSSSDDRITIT